MPQPITANARPSTSKMLNKPIPHWWNWNCIPTLLFHYHASVQEFVENGVSICGVRRQGIKEGVSGNDLTIVRLQQAGRFETHRYINPLYPSGIVIIGTFSRPVFNAKSNPDFINSPLFLRTDAAAGCA